MRPSLGDVDTVETEIVRLATQPQDEIRARLKRRERHADTARLTTFLILEPLIGWPGKCAVQMRVHYLVPVPP